MSADSPDGSISVTKVVNASPQEIFDLLADPAMHPVLDGSGTVRASRDGNPARLSLGAKFGMSMKLGVPYRIKNKVVVFDEPRHIAWKHVAPHQWHYRLEPVEGGTAVTETWDLSHVPAPLKLMFKVQGAAKRNRRGITATLDRLAARFATRS